MSFKLIRNGCSSLHGTHHEDHMFNKKKLLSKNPGILVANHGGFCWGSSAEESFLNFQRLEFIAELGFKTINEMINLLSLRTIFLYVVG